MTSDAPNSQPTACEHNLVIRRAQPEDIERIDLFLADFVAAERILPRTIDEMEQLIPTGFVAEVNDQIVGFVTLEIYSRKLAEVRSLCVRPIMQGQGIGKKLINACIELARERNVFEVMAITSTDQFFRTCGFDFTLPGEKKALFLQTRDTP
ncbi:Amino-acid acetyltransferase [Thalassoglobus neptunius]|uniref:Amino-acid acetyltransferase n=1 Tax=Thalassoglobus neptunius TaxID=1938619 RepID=A0A5C5X1P2_9PLAN|nr:GNAT family N-acetyltransferase [Thalassoglobus neptunius]TWT56836.1 Amino-acid acetyltransferase [Thalassoglobus neptunius]